MTPTIAAVRSGLCAFLALPEHLAGEWRRCSISTIPRKGGIVSLAAVLLIALAALSDRHSWQPDLTGQLRAVVASPLASGSETVALAAGSVDVVEDGVDIHLALRGQQTIRGTAGASPSGKFYADPVSGTGLWLPERPPRVA